MAEMRRSQHEALGGSYSPDAALGGFITDFDGIWLPSRDAQDGGGYHDTSFVDMFDSLVKRVATALGAYVYKDDADADLEFSVTPFTIAWRGMLCAYAGGVNISGLAAGQTKKIWADLTNAPTVTIAAGDNWPTTPHVMLDEIAAPASGPWLEQHRTRHLKEQAVMPYGGTRWMIRKDFTFADDGVIQLGNVPAGAMVGNARILTSTAFNGTAPVIKIGDAGQDDRLGTTAEFNLPTVSVSGAWWKYYKYTAQTALFATLTAGGSTAGDAIILIEQH